MHAPPFGILLVGMVVAAEWEFKSAHQLNELFHLEGRGTVQCVGLA